VAEECHQVLQEVLIITAEVVEVELTNLAVLAIMDVHLHKAE
jgi:hypothetical protein